MAGGRPAGRPRSTLSVVATAAAAATAAVAVVVGVAPAPAAAARPYLADGRARDFVWTDVPELSDEWDAFDAGKWRDANPRWLGRAPSVFAAENVGVRRGRLQLQSRRDERYAYPPNPPGMPAEPRLYGNWTTAFVESRALALYGFFETRARPGSGVISSSFWMSWNTPTDWTEIDVFEATGSAVGGPGPGFPSVLFMNMHVFRRTGTSFQPGSILSQPGNYFTSEPLAAAYHRYALDWSAERIIWLFDGVPVRQVANVYHQQPIAVKYDSETMPNWFGLPEPEWRRHTFRITYLRTWTGEPRTRRARGDDAATTARQGRTSRGRPAVLPATGAARISAYALQRAPQPNSIEVAGLAQPVPRVGWGRFTRGANRASVRGRSSVEYFGPVVV